MTALKIEHLTLPGALLGAENPLPFFRNPAENRSVCPLDSLPADKRQNLGWQAGFRVLPYRMQDSYTRRGRGYQADLPPTCADRFSPDGL